MTAPRPLRDVRVVDFTMGWSGPLATRHLADMGAEVVKIEACGHMDWWRGWEVTPESLAAQEHETSAIFNEINRNKLGVAIDLTRTRSELVAENALLRQQVTVLRRAVIRPRSSRRATSTTCGTQNRRGLPPVSEQVIRRKKSFPGICRKSGMRRQKMDAAGRSRVALWAADLTDRLTTGASSRLRSWLTKASTIWCTKLFKRPMS